MESTSLLTRPLEPAFSNLRQKLIAKARQQYPVVIYFNYCTMPEENYLPQITGVPVIHVVCDKREVPIYPVNQFGMIDLDEFGQLPDPVGYQEVSMSPQEIQAAGFDHYRVYFTCTPLSKQVLDSLAKIAQENDSYIQSRMSFTIQPSPATSTILMMDSSIDSKQPLANFLTPDDVQTALVSDPQAASSFGLKSTDAVTAQNTVNWESLPPSDSRYIAYRNGQESKGLFNMYAMTKLAGNEGQTTLNAFTNDVKGQLMDALSSGKIRTKEQAKAVYNEVVNAAIRDNAIFSSPRLSPDGSSVIFGDQDSWMRFIADLATEVLEPVLRQLPPEPPKERQHRQSKKSPYINEEYALKDRQRLLTDFFPRGEVKHVTAFTTPRKQTRRGRSPKKARTLEDNLDIP